MTWRSILARAGCAGVQLPGNYKVIIEAMDRLAGKHAECWHATATIARAAQCCERTVRNCIAALKSLGLVEVYYDYRKTTRRRIRLLWKHASSFLGFMVANVDGELPANVCRESDPPPDPPIVEPEGNTVKENDDDGFARMTADAGPEPSSSFPKLDELIGREPEAPPVADGPPPVPPDTRMATPEEVKAVEEKAFKIWGESEETKSRVKEAAKTYTLSWTDRALDIAAAKAAKVSIGFGFVFGTLKRFANAGGPPPRPSPRPAPHTVSERTPTGPPAEATEADLEDLRRWAESSDPILSRFGRAGLAQREE